LYRFIKSHFTINANEFRQLTAVTGYAKANTDIVYAGVKMLVAVKMVLIIQVFGEP